jgi:hypothetical protein
MKDHYSIENLINTFQEHSDHHKKERDKWTNEHRKDLEDNTSLHDIDFDISLALKSMCESINHLYEYIERVEDQLNDRG